MSKIYTSSSEDIEIKLLNNREIKPSPDGRFQDCWYWTMSFNGSGDGYGQIQIDTNRYRVTRLAAHLWLGFDINSELLICHKCDNSKCFNPEHLFIGTSKDNTNDMIVKRRNKKGEEISSSKLIEEQVLEIRSRYILGNISQRELAFEFGVNQYTIMSIVNNRTWKHVKLCDKPKFIGNSNKSKIIGGKIKT